ncbi:hypothetical protein [Lysinibacillus sphaericus]|uniref:hypothetical protein n=1 Tax=Lysinibacillus TaxID=400634 RepID=UPI0012BC5836|nr:hypothetical protein [Lysinibacillus sphaericus]
MKLQLLWGALLCIYGISLFIKYFQSVVEGWTIIVYVLSGSLCIVGFLLIIRAIKMNK